MGSTRGDLLLHELVLDELLLLLLIEEERLLPRGSTRVLVEAGSLSIVLVHGNMILISCKKSVNLSAVNVFAKFLFY